MLIHRARKDSALQKLWWEHKISEQPCSVQQTAIIGERLPVQYAAVRTPAVTLSVLITVTVNAISV